MTLRFLLDTSVLSAPMASPHHDALLRKPERTAAHCATAAPAWHELRFGVMRLPVGRRRENLERYLTGVVRASYPVLPYDERAADWHARERARPEAAGTPPPFVDGQIVAIAATNDLTLVTLNARDFVRFQDVRVTSWAR